MSGNIETTKPEAAAPARRGLVRRALAWYWGQRDAAEKGEPVKRTLVAVVLLVVGVLGSEAYGALRDRFRDPDEFLVQMKQDQATAFAKLEARLGELGRSVDGQGRDALAEVRSAVGAMKDANAGLIAQLELARLENQRLAELASKTSGVAGGYDFILAANSALALDEASVVGVQNVDNRGAWVQVSAKDGNRRDYLRSGESIAFNDARGQGCRVSLLSVSSGRSAAFKRSCG